MNKYARILSDCPCSTSILGFNHGTTLVRHVIAGMNNVERSVIASYYGLHNSPEENIDEISKKISNDNTIITNADVVQALDSARSKLRQFDDFDGKVESIRIKWIPFRGKTKKALVNRGLHRVGDIVELEKQTSLQDVKGIGIKEALEIYEMLSPWYEPSSFTHYQKAAEEWREQYDPYLALIRSVYKEPDKEYIIPAFAQYNIDKAIQCISDSDPNLALAIREHFGFNSSGYPMTCEQLGESYLLVSKTRAQQVVNKAVRLLRQPGYSKGFEFVTFDSEKLVRIHFEAARERTDTDASFKEAQQIMDNAKHLISQVQNACREQYKDKCPFGAAIADIKSLLHDAPIDGLELPLVVANLDLTTPDREKLVQDYYKVFETKEYAKARLEEAQQIMDNAKLLILKAQNACCEQYKDKCPFGAAIAGTRALSYDTPIEELELPVRTHNKLRQNGIDTIGHIAKLGKSGLKEIKGFKRSDKRMQEVEDKLAAIFPSNDPFWKEYYK